MNVMRTGVVLAVLLACTPLRPAWSITLGQVDDFEDGTIMGWGEGLSSNPPTNVSTGGPDGEGDAFLRNVSSGVGFGGGKMVMFNTLQWTGDYTAEGVVRITADMANLGNEPLNMRIAIGSLNSQTGTWYASADAVSLPPDDVWRPLSFGLAPEDLTCVNSCALRTLDQLLADVNVLRILSASNPAFQGDLIVATLGVDNITALGADMTLIGDMDLDGDVDFDDIDDFVLGLNDAAAYEAMFGQPPADAGDTDDDGDMDFDDIPGFVSILSGAGVQSVAEPSSAALALGACGVLAGTGLRRWRRVRRRSSVARRSAVMAVGREPPG